MNLLAEWIMLLVRSCIMQMYIKLPIPMYGRYLGISLGCSNDSNFLCSHERVDCPFVDTEEHSASG